MTGERIGVVVVARSGPGVLHELTGVIALHAGNIASVEIFEERPPESRIYFEIDLPSEAAILQADLEKLNSVRTVTLVKTLQKVYGKRIIIVGGGAQVGQVAIGAISEADRHNIRGEHTSETRSHWWENSRSRMPFARWADYRVPARWCWRER